MACFNNIHQEGKHDADAHNLAEDFITSGLFGVSGVNIPFEENYSAYTLVRGGGNHHPMGIIRQKYR